MDSKIIFILILHISLGQWESCNNDKEAQSKEEIQQCFSDNASLDPCVNYDCSEKGDCNSGNLNNDAACLINHCQKKCKSKEKSCVTKCLNLDSCNERETKDEYVDCIRKSAESCFDDNEEHSKEEIKQCFLGKVSVDPCINYNCSGNSACNSSNINEDVACLINSCREKCIWKLESCYIKCLSLDSCSMRKTGDEYMDCVRKSAADYCDSIDIFCKERKCMAKGKSKSECEAEARGLPKDFFKTPKYNPERYNPNRGWPKDPPRDSRTTANSYGQATERNGLEWWGYLIIVILVVFVLLVSLWPMFAAFRMSNRGNVSTHTPVIDPRTIPKGAYPVQNMPMTVSAQGSQQSLGQGVAPYPSENQFEPQLEGTKRGKLPRLPEQKRVKSKL